MPSDLRNSRWLRDIYLLQGLTRRLIHGCSIIVYTLLLLALSTSCCATRNLGFSNKTSTILLPTGQRIQKSLSGTENDSYEIQLSPGQYFHALISRHGVDARLAIHSPEGKKIAEFVCHENEPRQISLIGEPSGAYKLVLSQFEPGAYSSSYELVIEAVRPATPQDRTRLAGEKAFIEAETLREAGAAESQKKALDKYEESLVCWRTISEKRGQAESLKQIGEIYHKLGYPLKAIDYYHQSLSLSHEAMAAQIESQVLNDLASVYRHLGKNQRALDYCIRALIISQCAEYRRGEATSYSNLGEVLYSLGNRLEALERYQRSFEIWKGLGDRRGQAQSLLDIGSVYSDISQTREAFDFFQQSLHFWKTLHDQRGQALTLAAIGRLHSSIGEKQEALNLYYQALSPIMAAGDRYWGASVLLNIGNIHLYLGDSDKAIEYYNNALQIWREIINPENEAGTLFAIGWLHHSLGQNEVALSNLKQAYSIFQTLEDKKGEPAAIRKIGSVYHSLGRKKEALSYFNKALHLYQKGKVRRVEVLALNDLGNVYRDLNEQKRSASYFKQALSISREISDRFGESLTLYNTAHLEADHEDFAEARIHIENALSIIESLRTNVESQTLRTTYFGSIQQYFELYIDLLMRQHKRQPFGNFDGKALEATEHARARSLLEQMTEAHADFIRWGDPSLLKRFQDLNQQINSKTELKQRRLGAKAPEEEIISISKEITSLIVERDQVEAQIRAKRPSDLALTQHSPSTLKEIQQLLDENTLLLEYSLGSERSYLWAVTPNEIRSYVLPKRSEIEKLARPVYEVISRTEFKPGQVQKQLESEYRQRAARLAENILRPIADQLGKKRLLIVADGILQYIPFQALPDPGMVKSGLKQTRVKGINNGNLPQPLMIEHEIINLPSASTLAVLRRETARRKPAPKIIAALVDPVFQEDDLRLLRAMGKLKDTANLQIASNNSPEHNPTSGQTRDGSNYRRLYLTKEEADVIEAHTKPSERLIAMGFDASRARATSPELSQYRIIHFGTHGTLDTNNPELSAIVLSFFDQKGQTQNGLLRLQDIYNLNLPADLVVLSACETALGKEIKGEGLIGLTRGFMYAGAARVMASLWKVEDRSTAELMKHFYTFLLRDKMPPAEALRRAQIEVWKQPNYSSPYHWAGFVLQGEYR